MIIDVKTSPDLSIEEAVLADVTRQISDQIINFSTAIAPIIGCPQCSAATISFSLASTFALHLKKSGETDEAFASCIASAFSSILLEVLNETKNDQKNNPSPTHPGPSTSQ